MIRHLTTASSISRLVDDGILSLGTDSVVEDGVQLLLSCDDFESQRFRIGDRTHLRAGAIVYSDTVVGSSCLIDHAVVIRSGARIGDGCKILCGTEIGSDVRLGSANRVLQNSLIIGRTMVGDTNTIGPFACIGTPPQHPGIPKSYGQIEIGDSNTIREFVTVHLPTTDGVTRIGSSCYIMAYNHISHDMIIEDNVKMANCCQIGGHSVIMHHAYLGLSCVVHQRITIGAGAMVGMGSVVVKDIPPFMTYVGNAGTKINSRGALLQQRSPSELASLVDFYSVQRGGRLELRAEHEREWWFGELQRFLDKQVAEICLLGVT